MGYFDFDLIEQSVYIDNAKIFVQEHAKYAKSVQEEFGMDYRILLTVSALETGYGLAVKHFNYFGVKYADGMEKKLITTTEYLSNPNAKFAEIISVTPVVRNGKQMYKYIVKDYFSVYPDPLASFRGYYLFLRDNPRYKNALAVKNDPFKFFEEVAKAGYATAPDYEKKLKQVYAGVLKRL